MSGPTGEALLKCKRVVYLYRIRLRPFFLDFDKLRTGEVFENQFLSALNQGGLHTLIAPHQLQLLANKYKHVDFQGLKGHQLHKVSYVAFLEEVEKVFGEKDLEKDPLKEVSNEPLHLLAPLIDRLRHSRATKQLEPSKEAHISELLERLLTDCKIKGIQVKHAFDDAAHAPKLPKIVNHVTTSQFFQGLCKLNLGIHASDATLLAEKFGHEEHPDLVNYALFSKIANPTAVPITPGGSPAGPALAVA